MKFGKKQVDEKVRSYAGCRLSVSAKVLVMASTVRVPRFAFERPTWDMC